MRSDVEEWNKRPLHTDFNPRSLHGERQCDKYISFRVKVFQSTLPAWGATPVAFFSYSVFKISIHAPRMGSDMSSPRVLMPSFDFNPRSPHGERQRLAAKENGKEEFQSTLPAWGATNKFKIRGRIIIISIHAPRMGSDIQVTCRRFKNANFNPRSPHGERLRSGNYDDRIFIFQSTLPAWGATFIIIIDIRIMLFQSTLPAWGATGNRQQNQQFNQFQSTLPAWGATAA